MILKLTALLTCVWLLMGAALWSMGARPVVTKHDCSPALIRAIDDAYQVLTQVGYDRQAEALKEATMAECKEPR